MAIKNTDLGGTDYADGEVVKAVDVNDTFDAAFQIALDNPCFWLNTALYDVYDDFDSYSTGAFTTNAKWNVTVTQTGGTGSGAFVLASTNAGGATKELDMDAEIEGGSTAASTILVKAINLSANKHTFIRLASKIDTAGGLSHSGSTSVSFDEGASYFDIVNVSAPDDIVLSLQSNNILVVAKGANEYDCYIGGKLVDNVTDATFQIWLRSICGDAGTTSNAHLYVDDVRQSKTTVN